MSNNEYHEPESVEEFRSLEVYDESIIERGIETSLLSDCVYSFESRGKIISGLTITGVLLWAQLRGNIETEKVEYRIEDGIIFTVFKAVDKAAGLTVHGGSQQAIKGARGIDDFANAKAISKGQRNAIRKLIPLPQVRHLIQRHMNNQETIDRTILLSSIEECINRNNLDENKVRQYVIDNANCELEQLTTAKLQSLLSHISGKRGSEHFRKG